MVAFASLNASEISIPLVDQVLKDIFEPQKNKSNLSIDLIKKVAAEYYSVKIDDMSAKIRTKEIAIARQIAMYLARELTGASLPKIGEAFGGRDHTTVLHAYEKIKSIMKSDPNTQEALKIITQKLKTYAP